VDGLHDLETRRSRPDRKNPWFEFIKDIDGFEQIAEPGFAAKPDSNLVNRFVKALLAQCMKYKPAWITVPQLPFVNDSTRNKLNRALAKASRDWKSSHSFSVRLILPVIFTHQDQIKGKTERNPKVAQAGRCYREAQADGFWVVDTSLTDESGSRTLRNTRFPAIIALHQELNDEISSKIKIAGPYWGLNLVLWTRGLVDYPAIGVGRTYQYYLPGGHMKPASARVAIGPLRRRVGVLQLKLWLDEVLTRLSPAHSAYSELDQMRKRLTLLSAPDTARRQVAEFYKRWFNLLAATPGRGEGWPYSKTYRLPMHLDGLCQSSRAKGRTEGRSRWQSR
jgi:hypothetical protein